MTTPIRIPPLPDAWPYQPRTALSPWETREGPVPGFEGRWTLEVAPGLAFDDDSRRAARMEGAFGRGGVKRLGDIVVRPYRRGGLVAKVNGSVYASPARFRGELAVHRALWEAGFPTVEPAGLAHRRRGLGHEGLFFTRYAEAKPWPADWSPLVLPDLMGALAALDAWGLFAPDLNATNVLSGPGGLLLLDWDRAAWRGGPLLPRYRARLARSLAKLGAPSELEAAFRR